MKKNHTRTLRIIVLIYIALTFLFAGLNFGFSPGASPEVQETIHLLWDYFENIFKTGLVIIGGLLTFLIVKDRKKKVTDNRKQILLSLTFSALAIHIILPLIFLNWEIYFVAMPLPWITAGFQLIARGEAFGRSYLAHYGTAGVSAMIGIFWGYNIIILIATLLWGRRAQCSQLCMFNGFMAECFSPALPLIGKSTPVSRLRKNILHGVRIVFFSIFLTLTVLWIVAIRNPGALDNEFLDKITSIETSLYMSFSLFGMILFWIILGPRTYCAYCPAGAIVGLIGKHIARQAITTGHTTCTSCGACSRSCPIGLDPMKFALEGKNLKNSKCLGCKQCVEVCPTDNLQYSTAFTRALAKKKITEQA